jgi:hypothetical protein
MAYLNTNNYFLCYKNKKIATITNLHSSLGWVTGSFEPLPLYTDFRDFLLEYFKLEDDWGHPEFWNTGIEKLENKFEKELVVDNNWTKVDSETGGETKIMIPFIDESKRMTWREYSIPG